MKGNVLVNGKNTEKHYLVEFNNDAEELTIEALTEAKILLGHAKPFNEPVAAEGPFVMNTEKEIREAFQDYRSGKFGVWEE
ncbi:hypothetical protein OSR52_07990 [Galbibacter sp. CMA-7]|uniref:Pirin C-terminal domain-containing protein n=1 Tax=Galbibacter pacificus TaxID=2996052 RepID=A0ABT6FRB2_9FLAO|nr:pirin-like C-terminal cupin domain-containing protein [Galbibacter pacificus]MDG3581718.1 pirin-like C-terminal cupin domain-containing protein [Galbibacter pacificus]MDG3585808.1 hypothetical protein [Galbibacter pacificus]